MLTALDSMDTSLLSPPTENESTTPISRPNPDYSNQDTFQFLVKEKIYTQQYAGIYFTRLNMLRPRVLETARMKWASKAMYVPKVLDVLPGKVSYIIGTVYKDMPLKPCILDTVARESWVLPPPPREKYTSENDAICLEDESGRIKLFGRGLQDTLLVTGVVAGFMGVETVAGDFEVVEVCYPSFEPQPALPMVQDSEEGSWIGFVSGLELGKEGGLDLSCQMMIDYLTGELGSPLVGVFFFSTRSVSIPTE